MRKERRGVYIILWNKMNHISRGGRGYKLFSPVLYKDFKVVNGRTHQWKLEKQRSPTLPLAQNGVH